MFSVMICVYRCFPKEYNSLNYHFCDIFIANTLDFKELFSCATYRTVWLGIMENVFNASFNDRIYSCAGVFSNSQPRNIEYVDLDEKGTLREFSPPIHEGRTTCFR